MAAAYEDGECASSHEETQIYTYTKGNYSCETTEPSEQRMTTDKNKRLQREGWGVREALWELQGLSRPEEGATALVHSSLHFHRAHGSFTGGALAYLRAHCCTSPAIIPAAFCF